MRDLTRRALPYLALALTVGLWLVAQWLPTPTALAAGRAISGRLITDQGEPVAGAEVVLFINTEETPFVETQSNADGSYLLVLPDADVRSARIEIERSHFWPYVWTPSQDDWGLLSEEGFLVVSDITLERRFTAGFWVAGIAFVGMLALIATERLQNTLAALLGVALIFSVSFVGGAINHDLFIFDFTQALTYVDFNVIFLLMGMMIMIGIIEDTGIFQWLAFQAYRLSGGRPWLLTLILMVITAVASALLDNVTTMLLMTPITLQIALALGINPLSLLMPEVLASNVGGISTLIGTPTNILIGSYAGLGFNDFLTNLTPGVLLALAGLAVYVLLRYRREHRKAGGELSPTLLERLEENARIREPQRLLKSGIVFGVVLLLFVFGERIHLVPAVTAIIGAVAMLMWVNPDIEQMMRVVDWTTLMFFIGLFIVVGAIQEVGLIDMIAGWVGDLVGGNLTVALLVLLWLAALLSGVIANIPFTAAMLPLVRFLTRTIPGGESNVLYYGLSVGSAMGGNSSLIGASANLVTAGMAERAGYPITFKKFLAVGLPAVLITVAIGCGWLLIRF